MKRQLATIMCIAGWLLGAATGSNGVYDDSTSLVSQKPQAGHQGVLAMKPVLSYSQALVWLTQPLRGRIAVERVDAAAVNRCHGLSSVAGRKSSVAQSGGAIWTGSGYRPGPRSMRRCRCRWRSCGSRGPSQGHRSYRDPPESVCSISWLVADVIAQVVVRQCHRC